MKIAVLFGGTSAERDVSLVSGIQVIKALKELGHEVIAIDTARGALEPSEERRLLAAEVATRPPETESMALMQSDAPSLAKALSVRDADVVFLTLHGGTGEDGTIQALLDLIGIPYTGSGHSASAYAMDKDISKQLFQAAGIPTPSWIMLRDNYDKPNLGNFAFPVIVKPNKQGSTIGVTLVKESGTLRDAIVNAQRHDDEVMVEEFIPGRELTVAILNDKPLPVGEIVPKRDEIFDYESKYQLDGAEEIFPADLSTEESQNIQDLALRAHRALKLEGYSRVDFRMDPSGKVWCLEVNTSPGMTKTSLLPKAAQAAGISFAELCEQICELAIERRRRGVSS